ncbi:MAG: alpha/beta fold hydrolase [Streptococcaceae bacterium]|jgi:uncharacterized alpha/beta hydrolase family protein|nr:alpha/beta fold hydrolase [Streptococcaceae bacterium]
MNKREKYLIGVIVALAIMLISVSIFYLVRHTDAKNSSVAIEPTIFITGSDGKLNTIDPLVQAITNKGRMPARKALSFVVQTDGTVDVSGRISKANIRPAIEVGMEEGTNSGVKQEAALKAVVLYLQQNYNVTALNMVGFSAGGTGVLHYLVDYSNDSKLPPVKKFISLDGQYNASTAQPDQTLDEVLKSGPKVKSQYFAWEEENIQKINPSVKIYLMAGNYKNSNSTDGVVPWADTFSIYYLFKANGNPLVKFTYGGADDVTWHGYVPKNPNAQKFIGPTLYAPEKTSKKSSK